MTAVAQAGIDLTQMRIQFADQQFNLEASLKKAKEMSEEIKTKITKKIGEIMDLFTEMSKKTKEKLAEVAGTVAGNVVSLNTIRQNCSTVRHHSTKLFDSSTFCRFGK